MRACTLFVAMVQQVTRKSVLFYQKNCQERWCSYRSQLTVKRHKTARAVNSERNMRLWKKHSSLLFEVCEMSGQQVILRNILRFQGYLTTHEKMPRWPFNKAGNYLLKYASYLTLTHKRYGAATDPSSRGTLFRFSYVGFIFLMFLFI